VLAGSASFDGAISIGDRLVRDYTVYSTMPVNVSLARAQGWSPMRMDCLAGLGIPYAQGGSDNATSTDKPIVLYFTPAGQAAGVGVYVLGDSKPKLVERGFLTDAGTHGSYKRMYISVSFRAHDAACSSSVSALPLGDRLVVNAGSGGIAMELPVTRSAAQASGWVAGSCFQGMGTHWFKDLSGKDLSWRAENLLPVVVMFDEESDGADEHISAFFFATPDRQQSMFPPSTNQWEPIPLPNFAMCKNFCDSACTFHDTSAFSTLHVYLRDYTKVTCHNGCTIGCCAR